ncbi:histidine kinase [bacterium]|nr:histidine kinase [bacterium]
MRISLESLIVFGLFVLVYFAIIPFGGDVVFYEYFNSVDGSLYFSRTIDALISTIILMISIKWFIPTLLRNKELLSTYLIMTALIAGCIILEYLLDHLSLILFNLPTEPGLYSDKMLDYPQRVILPLSVIPGTLLVLGFSALSGVSFDWFKKSRRQKALEHARMQADINFLRSQIDPHFFFNTLNNIYAITQRNDDRQAGEALLKLSELMRYMIYESAADSVLLQSEVDHIIAYLEIARLKFAQDDPVSIIFNNSGDLSKVSIAPLLLLPFVENSIKHGVNSRGEGSIDINLEYENGLLSFSAKNTHFQKQGQIVEKTGLGLDNVTKRLSLIYPDRHELKINQLDKYFEVKLAIEVEEE